MPRKAYDTDLTDDEWEICDKILKATLSRRGRPPIDSHRETLDTIFYRMRAGCQWRNLPHDFPRWDRIYATYHRWVEEGTWKKIHDALCCEVRKKNNRETTPSVVIIDSQSVKADGICEEIV